MQKLKPAFRGALLATLIALVTIFAAAGCAKHVGEAVVLSKEYIDAAAAPSPSDTQTESIGREASNVDAKTDDGETITVDSYAMKPEVRGTSRDPRAMAHEQWLVKVRMTDTGRTFNVPVDRGRFVRLKEGDRVRVRYQTGKYTDTVWASEISE